MANGGYWVYSELPSQNVIGDTVTPVDIATHRAGRPIKVAPDPGALAITPDGRTLYVLQNPGRADAVITPVDLATGRAAAPLHFPGGAGAMVMSRDGRTLYVTARTPDEETIPVSVASDREGRPILAPPVYGGGDVISAITPDGATLFTATSLQDVPGQMTVDATDTRTGRTRLIAVPASPKSLAVSPDGRVLYVLGDVYLVPAYPGPQDLLAIDIATGKVGKPVRLPAFQLRQIVISPDGRTMYAAGSPSDDQLALGPVILPALAPGQMESQLTMSLRVFQASVLAISSDGQMLYLADGKNIMIRPAG